MKSVLLGFLALLPLIASAQSSLSPEAQAASDNAMRGLNEAAASQIQHYESQSRAAQRNIDRMLLEQKLQRLSDQQADAQRQLLQQQRNHQEFVEETLRRQEATAGQEVLNNDANATASSPQAPQAWVDPSAGGGDVFAKALSELEINYAGNLPPPPALQTPSSLHLMREAGLTKDVRLDVAGDLAQLDRERTVREAETFKNVIETLSKQGCSAFRIEPGNSLPACSSWGTINQATSSNSDSGMTPGHQRSYPSSVASAPTLQRPGPARPENHSLHSLVPVGIAIGVLALMIFAVSGVSPKGKSQASEVSDQN